MEIAFHLRDRILSTAAAVAVSLLVATSPVLAQQGAVTGEVVNAQNLEPISGAQVFIPGTGLGTLTGDEGSYRLTDVPAGTHTVRVQVIGFRAASQRVTVTAGEGTTADFQLQVSAVSLEEIVVTQTGEQRQRELTNAITTISATETVEEKRPANLSDLLQTNLPGANIRQSSGSVGTNSSITIRGPTSISLDNTPIIYIDGVRVNNDNTEFPFFTGGQQASRLNDLNPENIESIQVLKGPSASTLYGSEAAAGVLRITTKQGSGEPRWNVRAQVGGNWDPTNWPSATYNPQEDPLLPLTAFGFPKSAVKDTIYQMNVLEGESVGIADPFRTGLEQSYELSTQGGFGEGNVSYFVSAERNDQDGNLLGNKVRGWNLRGNFSYSTDDVSLRLSNGFVSKTTFLPQNDNNGLGYIGETLLGLPIWNPIMAGDPVTGEGPMKTCPLSREFGRSLGISTAQAEGILSRFGIGCEGNDPLLFGITELSQIGLVESQDAIQRYTGSLNLTYDPTHWLTTRLTGGYDVMSREDKQLIPVRPDLIPLFSGWKGDVEKMFSTVQTLTLQASATSTFDLTEDIGSETTAGAQFSEDQTDLVGVDCEEFPAGSPACDNSVTTDLFDGFSEKRTVGYFAEQRFSWRDKLFVDGGIRFDDGSAFGANLDLQAFPRVGFSYILSDEDWFPGLFEQFKLRGAWGQSGKQPGTNDALALLSSVSVPFRGAELLGVQPQRPGNPVLKPERDTEWEVGAELSLLNGRLNSTVTWYRKEAEDAVVSRQLAPSIGFPGDQITNIGQMVNKGFEVTVDANAVSRPNLEWNWTAQFATVDNEITELLSPIVDIGFVQRHIEGDEFGAFWGRRAFIKDDGSVAVTDTAVKIGETSGISKVTGSLSSTMTLFGHVSLHAAADVNTGSELQNNTESFRCWFLGTCAQIFETNPDGTLTDRAKLIKGGAQARVDGNSVYDADFVKLRTASLRIRIPRNWLSFYGVDEFSLSVIGRNLATWTPYPGVDPELNMFGGNFGESEARSDFLTLPPNRSVTAVLSASF